MGRLQRAPIDDYVIDKSTTNDCEIPARYSMTTNFEHLRNHILPLSEASAWNIAKYEWDLVGVYDDRSSDVRECPCTHSPIVEICELHNRVTGAQTEVGNVCVNRFLGINSASIFAALRRISSHSGNIANSLNADAIVFFRERGVLTSWEYKFLNDIWRKRKLSLRQLEHRVRINRKVLAAVSRRGLALRPVNPFLPKTPSSASTVLVEIPEPDDDITCEGSRMKPQSPNIVPLITSNP
jgi:hypothetical protein